MAETKKLPLPKSFEAVVKGQEYELPNKHGGYVTVPVAWEGKDWEGFYKASIKPKRKPIEHPDGMKSEPLVEDHMWLRQWRWAKDHIVEWHIKDLPTNPNQIKDDELHWPLMAWLTHAVHAAMNEYKESEADKRKAELSYPTAATLTAGEFFAWEKASREIDVDAQSPLLSSWKTGRVLVRSWANGKAPDAAGLEVDLALIAAVDQIAKEVIYPAIDLGKLPSLRGER